MIIEEDSVSFYLNDKYTYFPSQLNYLEYDPAHKAAAIHNWIKRRFWLIISFLFFFVIILRLLKRNYLFIAAYRRGQRFFIVFSHLLSMLTLFGSLRMLRDCFLYITHFGSNYSLCHPQFYYNSISLWIYIYGIIRFGECIQFLMKVMGNKNILLVSYYVYSSNCIFILLCISHHSAPFFHMVLIDYIFLCFKYTVFSLSNYSQLYSVILDVIVAYAYFLKHIYVLLIHITVLYWKLLNVHCQMRNSHLLLGIVMHFSYLVLTTKMIYREYKILMYINDSQISEHPHKRPKSSILISRSKCFLNK